MLSPQPHSLKGGSIPVFWTCSSLLARSRMDLIASSDPVSEARIRVVMFPVGRKKPPQCSGPACITLDNCDLRWGPGGVVSRWADPDCPTHRNPLASARTHSHISQAGHYPLVRVGKGRGGAQSFHAAFKEKKKRETGRRKRPTFLRVISKHLSECFGSRWCRKF